MIASPILIQNSQRSIAVMQWLMVDIPLVQNTAAIDISSCRNARKSISPPSNDSQPMHYHIFLIHLTHSVENLTEIIDHCVELV